MDCGRAVRRVVPARGRRPVAAAYRLVLVALCAAAFVLGGAARTAAQSASAAELKAPLLLNFARFAAWPDLRDHAPLLLCVFGDDRVACVLVASVRGRDFEGRDLLVSKLTETATPGACQVLFVGGPAVGRGGPLLDTARTLPVLTVSDRDGFAQSSGMIELFEEGGRMRFTINVDAVRRSRVALSSRLLGLARVIRDPHGQ